MYLQLIDQLYMVDTSYIYSDILQVLNNQHSIIIQRFILALQHMVLTLMIWFSYNILCYGVFIHLFILVFVPMVIIFDIMIMFNDTNLYHIILQNHTFLLSINMVWSLLICLLCIVLIIYSYTTSLHRYANNISLQYFRIIDYILLTYFG